MLTCPRLNADVCGTTLQSIWSGGRLTLLTLLLCWQVPSLFQDDLFFVLDNESRPDFRWLIMGPARSGSSFHKDPNATSAWNAVIKGSKKWILFPPNTTPPGLPAFALTTCSAQLLVCCMCNLYSTPQLLCSCVHHGCIQYNFNLIESSSG